MKALEKIFRYHIVPIHKKIIVMQVMVEQTMEVKVGLSNNRTERVVFKHGIGEQS